MRDSRFKITTVTPNPALDKVLWIDGFQTGKVNRVVEMRVDPGGKGINVSRFLSKLGKHTRATGFMGRGHAPFLIEQLSRESIETDFVDVSGYVRMNLKIIDRVNGCETEINEPGPAVCEAEVSALEDKVRLSCEDSSVIVFAGSLPPGCPTDLYYRLIALANQRGVRTILDASSDALREGLRAAPFLVKPNLQELEELFGTRFQRDTEIIDAAREIVRSGVKIVVVSMGSDGAIAVARGWSVGDSAGEGAPAKGSAVPVRAWRAFAPEVRVGNTVGAGDAMVAGLAASLARCDDIATALKFAVAAGSAAASDPGTGQYSVELARHLQSEVVLTQVSS
ncbi:MAG: 1-phosphofructokinase [Firmicutes bacterium]|nr:1-phosphofructokinase [Candidatus Fermentithermobacillaceae bacterium]